MRDTKHRAFDFLSVDFQDSSSPVRCRGPGVKEARHRLVLQSGFQECCAFVRCREVRAPVRGTQPRQTLSGATATRGTGAVPARTTMRDAALADTASDSSASAASAASAAAWPAETSSDASDGVAEVEVHIGDEQSICSATSSAEDYPLV